MMQVHNTIVTETPPDKASLRERRRQWAKVRPTRQEFNALKNLWRDGLIYPSEQFLDLIAPRDSFPPDRAGGNPGLEPRLRVVAFPDTPYGESYSVLDFCDGDLAIERTGLQRCEAWRVGIAAVKEMNAEFVLLNQTPNNRRQFSRRGGKCIVSPNGLGQWSWGAWGGGCVPRGGANLSKSDCLREAEVCVLCGDELFITNSVPLNREEWEKLYVV